MAIQADHDSQTIRLALSYRGSVLSITTDIPIGEHPDVKKKIERAMVACARELTAAAAKHDGGCV